MSNTCSSSIINLSKNATCFCVILVDTPAWATYHYIFFLFLWCVTCGVSYPERRSPTAEYHTTKHRSVLYTHTRRYSLEPSTSLANEPKRQHTHPHISTCISTLTCITVLEECLIRLFSTLQTQMISSLFLRMKSDFYDIRIQYTLRKSILKRAETL